MATSKEKIPLQQSKHDKLPSAYGLYFRDTVNAIKHKDPSHSVQELSRIVAAKWDILDPVYKAVYQEKCELAKRKYLQHGQTTVDQQEEQLETNRRDTSRSDNGRDKKQTMGQLLVDDDKSTNNTISTTTTAASQGEKPDAQADRQLKSPAEAEPLQKCTRKNCTKRAFTNPDWDDVYCSNECALMHCCQVFDKWLLSSLDSNDE